MPCILKITDPILKGLVGKEEFKTIDELREAFNLLADNHSVIPLNIQSRKETFARRKFAKVYKEEDKIKVQVVMPGQENFLENLLGRPELPEELKQPSFYGDTDIKVLSFPSIDNFLGFYLANYLYLNEANISNLIKNLESIVQNTLDRIDKKVSYLHSYEIEDLGFADSLVNYSKLLYNYAGIQEPQIINDLYEKIKDKVETYHTEKVKQDKVQTKIEKNLKKEAEPQPQPVIYFETYDYLFAEKKPNQKPLAQARRDFVRAIKDSSKYRVKLSRGSVDYAQEVDLSTDVILGGVVGILVDENNNQVYLRKDGELTTNREEAIWYDYSVEGSSRKSPTIQLLLNNTQFGKLKKDFLESSNPDEFVFQVSKVKVQREYEESKSFKESGFKIEEIQINILKDEPLAGTTYILKNDNRIFVDATSLTEEEIDEVIPLLERTYDNEDDLINVVEYLNNHISVSQERVLEESTGKEISFYPHIDRIIILPGRIKEGDIYKYVENPQMIFIEENPELIRKSLRAARIRFRKQEGTDKVQTTWTKWFVEDNQLKSKVVKPKEGEKFYIDHIKDIKTQVYESTQLVTFDKPVIPTKDDLNQLNVGLLKVEKDEEYTIGQINQLVFIPLTNSTPFDSPGVVKEKEDQRLLWSTIYNIKGKLPRFIFTEYDLPNPAFYDKKTGNIFIKLSKVKKDPSFLRKALVEELLHAITVPRLNQYKDTVEYNSLVEDWEKAKQLQTTYKDTEQYKALLKNQQEYMDKMVDYYLQSLEEFVVGINNYVFRAFLRLGESKGFVEELIDKIKKILNKILKDVAPSLYTDVTTDLFKFVLEEPKQIEATFISTGTVEEGQTSEEITEPEQVVPKKRERTKVKLEGKFFAPPFDHEDSVSTKVVESIDAEIGDLLFRSGRFGHFVMGDLLVNDVWATYHNSLIDEEQETKDNDRLAWIDYFFEKENKLKESWVNNSKLYRFSEGKLFFEEEVEEDETDEAESPEQMEGKDIGFNKVDTEQKYSRLQLADKYAKIFIRLTPKGQENGLTQLADFTSLWNKIANELEGTTNYDEQIEILKDEQVQKRIPELVTIVERLENLPADILNVQILNSIQNSFSSVEVTVWIPFFTEVRSGQDISSYKFSFFEQASLDKQNLETQINQGFRQFAEQFKTTFNQEVEGSIQQIPTYDNHKLAQFLKSTKDLVSTYRQLGFPIPEVDNDQFSRESQLSSFNKYLINLLETRYGNSYITNGDFIGYIRGNKSWELVGKLITSPGISTQLNILVSAISKYSPLTVSNMTKNAEGQNQSILLSWSSWFINNKKLNNDETSESFFRRKNPIFKYSIIGNLVNEQNPIRQINLNGSQYYDGATYEGETSLDLDYIKYLRQEIGIYMSRGVAEINRAEAKQSTFGYFFNWRLEGDTRHPIVLENFKTDKWKTDLFRIYEGYLRGELERIQLEIGNPYTYYSKYDNIKTDFHLLTFLPDSVKSDKGLEWSQFYSKNKEQVRNSILSDVQIEVDNFKQHVKNFTGFPLTSNHPILNIPEIQKTIKEMGFENFLKGYVVNRRIYQIEHFITGHGDIGQHDKPYKRFGSNISTGTPVDLNQKTLDTLNNTLDRTFTKRIPTGKSFVLTDDIFNYQDDNFKQGVKQSLTDTYNKFGIEKSEKELNNLTEDKVKPYEKTNVTDGQGFMTPDFGRMLMIATGNWSLEREAGFWFKVIQSKIDRKESLTQQEISHYEKVNQEIKRRGIYWTFPVLKMQYRGPFNPIGTQPNVAIEGLDKFSLEWLWPDEMEGKLFQPVLTKMLEEGYDYGKFESGTKIGSFIPDDLMGMIERGEVVINSGHTIDLGYMKEQVKAPDKYKNEMPMSSQARKLILSNLKSNKEYLTERIKEGVNEWKETQTLISEENKKKLIEEISTDNQIDNKKLADKVKSELSKRDLPDSFQAIFVFYGERFYDRFEQALSPQLVETLIYSLLKNQIVRPKYKGEHYIQVTSTLHERERRDLKFYQYNPEETIEAECKITLSGEFLKLLNLKEVKDNLPKEYQQLSEYEKIEYKRLVLNELLLDPNFVAEHKDSLTVYSSRIPGQGFNSMDIFRVKEFLPADHGPVIVLPAQATMKSGTDFDYDKLPTIIPELTKSGNYKDSEVNRMIRGAKKILLDPINFHRLVTPNSTNKFDSVIDQTLTRLGQDISEPKFDSIFRITSHLNKWWAMKMKNPLGIGATNNTFYTLQQDADVELNSEFEVVPNLVVPFHIPFERENKPFYYPYVEDTDKLEYVNQFINITVDVASNDRIGYTGLRQENTPLLLFLLENGVNFNQAFYFINQPIVIKYHQLINYYLDKGKSITEARNLTINKLIGIPISYINKIGKQRDRNREDIYKDVYNLIKEKPFLNLENSIIPLSEIPETFDSKQKSYLAFYLIGLEMAEKQREAQQYNNFDTSPSSNLLYSVYRESLRDKIRFSGLFNMEGIDKIHTDSVISHLNVHKEFSQISTQAFPIKRNPTFVRESLRLGSMIYNSRDRDKFFRKSDNDYLLAILQNYGTIDKERVENNLRGYLMEKWQQIKKLEEVKDLTITKYVSENYSTKTPYVSPALSLGLDSDSQTLDQIANDIRTLNQSDNREVRQWVKDFIENALFTTLFTQSPTYYLKALPSELVTPYLKEAFDNYQTNQDNQDFISEFSNKFRYQRGMEFGQYFLPLYKLADGVKNVDFRFKRLAFNQEAWRYTDYELTLPEVEQESSEEDWTKQCDTDIPF